MRLFFLFFFFREVCNQKESKEKQKQPFVRSTHIDNYSFEQIFSLFAHLPKTQWMSKALIEIL